MVDCKCNDVMTALSELKDLKRLSIKSNAEAFAPSFTLKAIESWTNLESLQFEQITDVLPKKNHNLDYEFIDLDDIVLKLAQRHGGSLKTLKMHFPMRLRPINCLTGSSLRNLGVYCHNLKSLWLNHCQATYEDVEHLGNLDQLEFIALDFDHGLGIAGASEMLLTPKLPMLTPKLPKLRTCHVMLKKNSRLIKLMEKLFDVFCCRRLASGCGHLSVSIIPYSIAPPRETR